MGIFIFIGFSVTVLVLTIIKTNIKINQEEKSLREKENNSHHNMMIF